MNPAPLPSLTQAQAQPWERLALALALLLVAVVPVLEALLRQPGFAAFDEETPVALAQAWREGQPLAWLWGKGSLHHALVAVAAGVAGPSLPSLRLPSLLAVLLEGPLLYLWVRPRLGERAAAWACLAQWVGCDALLRARMICSPALLPCVFLAHAVWLDRLRRPWEQVLFALSAGLWLLDYDGWLLALAVLLPWWLVRSARQNPRAVAAAAAGALAAAAIFAALRPGTGGWLGSRLAFLAPSQAPWAQAWDNLCALLAGGPRVPFSGVAGWPWPAPWIWPLALLGLAPASRRWPGLWLLLLVGAAPLALRGTAVEPHRVALAHVALAVMAGAGAAWLWPRRWGPALLAVLLVLGAAAEYQAYWRRDPAGCRLAYGRSQDMQAAAAWLRQHQPDQGWTVLDGLGPWDDASWRLLLDAQGLHRSAGPVVALLTWDYQPALRGLQGQAMLQRSAGAAEGGVILFLPGPSSVDRLRKVGALCAPLARLALGAHPRDLALACQSWLNGPGHRDPWARTVAWELWLHASLLDRRLDLTGVDALLREPLVSGWAPDVLAKELAARDPQRAARCAALALRIDPRRKGWSLEQRCARF